MGNRYGKFGAPKNQTSAQLKQLREALHERDAQLRQLRAALGERDAQLGQLREALGERDARLKDINSQMAERAELFEQLTETQVRLKESAFELAALRNSTSWRVTAPTRWMLRPLWQLRRFAVIIRSGLFDRDWYLQNNPDVAESGIDPIRHYLEHGAMEGRDPCPKFSTRGYLALNPDVAVAGINPLVHFIKHGAKEGRRGGPSTMSGLPLGTASWLRVLKTRMTARNIRTALRYLREHRLREVVKKTLYLIGKSNSVSPTNPLIIPTLLQHAEFNNLQAETDIIVPVYNGLE